MPLAMPTAHPGLLRSIRRHYPQRVTIQRRTTTRDEWGSEVESWTDLPGHISIPARVVSNGPGTGAGGWSGEVYAPNGTYDVDGRTMSLLGHFPTVTEMDRAVWDGGTYDIQAVESDAESVATRLRTRKVR